MDADTLRIILAVVGALAIAGLYLWERRRGSRGGEDEDYEEDEDLEQGKREPRLGPWEEGEQRGFERSMRAADAAGDSIEQEYPGFDLKSSSPEEPPPEFPPGPLILMLHIVSLGNPFDGPALVHAAARFGLDAGEMEIFHCSIGEGVHCQTLFSMANMVKPGTFPFGAMDEFESPGVTLFAQLDGTHDDPGRMEEMLGTAHSLAAELGGEIRDQKRQPLTPEAERKLRERVMAFVRIRLARSGRP